MRLTSYLQLPLNQLRTWTTAWLLPLNNTLTYTLQYTLKTELLSWFNTIHHLTANSWFHTSLDVEMESQPNWLFNMVHWFGQCTYCIYLRGATKVQVIDLKVVADHLHLASAITAANDNGFCLVFSGGELAHIPPHQARRDCIGNHGRLSPLAAISRLAVPKGWLAVNV